MQRLNVDVKKLFWVFLFFNVVILTLFLKMKFILEMLLLRKMGIFSTKYCLSLHPFSCTRELTYTLTYILTFWSFRENQAIFHSLNFSHSYAGFPISLLKDCSRSNADTVFSGYVSGQNWCEYRHL